MNKSNSTGEAPKSLIAKLAEVMGEIGYVPKSGVNTFHNYKYVMEADLCDAVRERLAKRNVMLIPSVVGYKTEQVETGKEKKPQFMTNVDVVWTFHDGDTGEQLTFNMPGCGMDSGDKGLYKAITGSDKYALMKAFLIPTGDDPEKDDDAKPTREDDQQKNQQLRRETAKEMGIAVKEGDPDLVPKLQESIVQAKLKQLKESIDKQKADEAPKGEKPKLVTPPPPPAPKAPDMSERDRKLNTIIIPKSGLKRAHIAVHICSILGREPKTPKEAGEILLATPAEDIDRVIDATVRFVTQHSVEQNRAVILDQADDALRVEFGKCFAETPAIAEVKA